MKNQCDLSRFITAQKKDYALALSEIRAGKKNSHWMWYVFPQIVGLGKSSTSHDYAIKDLTEAKCFLDDSYLGNNLREICNALLALETNNPLAVFDKPDDKKLKSSMTLFSFASGGEAIFSSVLDKFFGGKVDSRTVNILNTKNVKTMDIGMGNTTETKKLVRENQMGKISEHEYKKMLQIENVDVGNNTLFAKIEKLSIDKSHVTLIIGSGGMGVSVILHHLHV